MISKLLDLAEHLVDVAEVLAKDAAFQHQGVVLAGTVAYLTQPVDVLIGIDANDGAGEGDTAKRRDP